MKNPCTQFTVIDGGRNKIESRLVEAFFTPYLPDNLVVVERLSEQLRPRLNLRDVTLLSQEPPRR